MRILGLDFGTKRVGVAISDELKCIAQSLEAIDSRDQDKCIQRIVQIIESKDVEEIVLGLPLNMNGTESESTKKTYAFSEKLKQATKVPLFF